MTFAVLLIFVMASLSVSQAQHGKGEKKKAAREAVVNNDGDSTGLDAAGKKGKDKNKEEKVKSLKEHKTPHGKNL